MPEAPEKLDLRSLDLSEEKRQELLRLFPEIRTEGGKVDFDRLKLVLGETVRSPEDFSAMLRLWRWYREKNEKGSQSALRRLCKENYLSFPRMRDWIDLREQLEKLCKTLKLDVASTAGGEIKVAFDVNHLHFFDKETARTILVSDAVPAPTKTNLTK